MSDAENIFNDDVFFGDTIDKSKEETEPYKIRECF